jgi:transposase
MQRVATIGLDIAKSVFQVHGVDAAGQMVIRRQLKRRQVLVFFAKLPPCLIGIEACASSHYWARELQAVGHTVRLIPPAYVKPYVKRQKNDAADAEAICEAVTRPNMRFVPIKTIEQQGCLVLHRTRHLLVRQQTATINSIRAHLAEFGIVAPVGRRGVEHLLEVVADANDTQVPEVARACVAALGVQLQQLKAQILEFDRRILAWHRSSEASRRLNHIPASAHCWPRLWLRALPTPRPSGQDGTSQPGSVSFRSRIRAEAKTSLATSANEGIAICVASSRPERSPSSAMPKSMGPSIDPGLWHCWQGGRRRLRLLHSPTSSRGSPGP